MNIILRVSVLPYSESQFGKEDEDIYSLADTIHKCILGDKQHRILRKLGFSYKKIELL